MNRRHAFRSLAILPVGAVTGCAALQAINKPVAGGSPQLSRAFNAVQIGLGMLAALAAGVAVAVPGAAPVINQALPYIDAASATFANLSTSMADATAQPLIATISTDFGKAIDAIEAGMARAPQNLQLAPLIAQLDQAKTVVALLADFGRSISNLPTASRAALPRYVHA